MIETLDNALQLSVGGICVLLAAGKIIASRKRKWTLLLLFYSGFFLGNLYWFLYLLFYQRTPQYYIADLSWWAGYLFLILLLKETETNKSAGRSLLPWLGPAFTAGMCMFFIQRGEYISNIIYAVFLGVLLWNAIRGLLKSDAEKRRSKNTVLCGVTLFFCAMEYAEWTASCFWVGDTLKNPYFWFDTLLTVCFPLFLPAVRKAAEE